MNSHDTIPTATGTRSRCAAGPLPVDPFESLRPHFGMLLGVDDFETVDAYHRGKMWLHNAWLHRQGAVWGLGVALEPARGEVEVAPGLAIDGLGRELPLDTAACLHLGRWYAAHENDAAWTDHDDARMQDGDVVTFTAHVTLRAKRCLARPVPALVEPCDGDDQITAFSRVQETVELRLEPGPAPARGSASRPLPYVRLRLLFGIAAARTDADSGDVLAEDQAVLDARAAILALDPDDQPTACLDAFRHFAALDTIDLRPASEGGVPVAEPGTVVLAELRDVVVRRQDDETWAFDPDATPTVDNAVRDVHVATTTVQDLLCGRGVAASVGSNGDEGDEGDAAPAEDASAATAERATPADACGPRAQADTVAVTARQVSVALTAPVLPATASASSTSVAVLDDGEGWRLPTVRRVFYAASQNRLVVELTDDLPAGRLRLIVRGTGPTPLLGADGLPFAGGTDAPAAGRHDGNDFVHMIER